MVAFWIKKFVAFWFMPLNVAMLLLGTSLVLGRNARYRNVARGCLWAALAVLLVISNRTCSRLLIWPLERSYAPIPEAMTAAELPERVQKCRFILVLGAGHTQEAGWPATVQMSNSGLGRLTEAVRLGRLLPSAKLIMCGPGEKPEETHAKALMRGARALGLLGDRFALVETVRDTEDEVREAKKIAGNEPVALVTTACHMPRAMALCAKAGLVVEPCPTDFLGKFKGAHPLSDFGWDSESVTRSTFAFREYLGRMWIWLKG